MSRPEAAFLDRDGTIIRDPGYLSDPRGVRLVPRSADAIARLNAAGVPVIVVTNQSGIGRGLFRQEDFQRVQAALERRLALAGAALDAVYYCPHDPEREPCECRKPGLELYREASRAFGVSLGRSMFVGDRRRDVEPARQTGGMGYLVRTGGGAEEALPSGCREVADLWEAVAHALAGEDDG